MPPNWIVQSGFLQEPSGPPRIRTVVDYAGRLNRVHRAMAEQQLDLLAIPPGDDLLYLTGFSPLADERPCYLFLSARGGLFLVPELNAGLSERHIKQPFAVYSDADGPHRALTSAHEQFHAVRRMAVGDTMRADALLLLQQTWPEASCVAASGILAALRMRKDPDEIEALRRAARTADEAVEAAFAACRPDATELAIARAAEEGFNRAGATEVDFTIVASGPNSAFPHYHPSDRTLRTREPVLLDLGSRLEGYHSDITRMGFIGEPSTRYREIHRIVEEAAQSALAAIKPGVPIREVDLAARRVIESAGYDEHFTHRTGHGIGLSGHEPPSITHTNEMPLEAGMAFSVEPGIYLPGEFGVRLEEIVVVTERGPEVLSRLPRDVRIVK